MDHDDNPTDTPGEEGASECWVCRNVVPPEAYVTLGSCGHRFCITCLAHWFRRRETCPFCRADVPITGVLAERLAAARAAEPIPDRFSLGWDAGFARPVRAPSPWLLEHPQAISLTALESSDPFSRKILTQLWSGRLCAACSFTIHKAGITTDHLAWTEDEMKRLLETNVCCMECKALLRAAPSSAS